MVCSTRTSDLNTGDGKHGDQKRKEKKQRKKEKKLRKLSESSAIACESSNSTRGTYIDIWRCEGAVEHERKDTKIPGHDVSVPDSGGAYSMALFTLLFTEQ